MYTPPGAKTLAEMKDIPQIRLGIEGFGGTGKTWAALTFPNPIVMNLDRGLGAHHGRADVLELPFYDHSFCRSIDPNFKPNDSKDVLIKWLLREGMKLSPSQTLVVDNNSQIQNFYHNWFNSVRHNFLTDKGKEDGFAEYKIKKQYYTEFLELLKAVPCHVVFLCHETEASIGKSAGKIRPLLSGQVADELMNYFTDFFRQLACEKPDDFSKIDANVLKQWGMTDVKEFKAICDKYPRNAIYYWKTESDNNFDGKCSSLVNYPSYLPADYASFEKYRRK